MNKISFAVAAVYGASMAKAQACSAQEALPDQTMEDKMALAELNYSYLDACVQDGRVTYEEFEALIGDIGEGGADRAENVRKFQMMDLDNNNEISLVELLQHYRIKYYPIDLQGSLPPFSAVKGQLFDYLKCRPKPSMEAQECTAQGYTKEDLKAVLPIMYPLHNILEDYISFEAYAAHEFALRDIDYNGIVEQWEQHKYDWHYKKMRGFWNNSKGLGNLKETVEDDGIMTFEQWNQQNNMMLKRDFKNKPIPENALQWRFWYFDRDRSGILSWWEYWSTIQEDHLQHWHFNQFFNAVDGGSGEGDNVITRLELTDYYTKENEDGALTPEDIDQMVDDFFKKYLRGNYQGDDNDQIQKWALWGGWHW